jgi:universal stress protein A
MPLSSIGPYLQILPLRNGEEGAIRPMTARDEGCKPLCARSEGRWGGGWKLLKASVQVTAEDITMGIRQILAPTDFSECSKQAVQWAYELAQTFGVKLTLLHVIEELPPYIGFLPSGGAATLLKHLERQARLDLAQLLARAEGVKVEVICQAVVGTPYHTILEVATAENVDLIVMATHGRTGLSHLMMGSVAERVVRMAPCPVLTIRPTAAAA